MKERGYGLPASLSTVQGGIYESKGIYERKGLWATS